MRLAISQLPDSGPGRPTDVRLRLASGDWLDVRAAPLHFLHKRRFGTSHFAIGPQHLGDNVPQQEREKLIQELQDAFAKIKVLSGFIPICASCKKDS